MGVCVCVFSVSCAVCTLTSQVHALFPQMRLSSHHYRHVGQRTHVLVAVKATQYCEVAGLQDCTTPIRLRCRVKNIWQMLSTLAIMYARNLALPLQPQPGAAVV